MESYNKLVRDKWPERLDAEGISYEKRTAEEHEFIEELFKKLSEEIAEFEDSKTIEELADIIEVIGTIKKIPEFQKVEKIIQKRLIEYSKFDKGVTEEHNYGAEVLFVKLEEKNLEFQQTKNIEKLTDILEVINAFKKLPEYYNVEEVRQIKLAEKGGFEKKIILKGEK